MITVIRDSGYADRVRKYKVFVDSVAVGEIGNGETKSFEVAEGTHLLQLRIDWAKSNQVNFVQTIDKEIKFKISSPLRGKNLIKGILYATIFSNKYLYLERIV